MNIEFNQSNNTYKLNFVYPDKKRVAQPNTPLQTCATPKYTLDRGTRIIAEVYSKASIGWDLVASGVSTCSVNDPFNRATGRKVALAKALASLPKPTRAIAWRAYFGRRHQ